MKKMSNKKKSVLKIPRFGEFISPEVAVGQWGMRIGSKAADLGCGSGYFTIAMAKRLGENGRVYAVDILDSALESVKSRAFIERLKNITLVKSDLEKSKPLNKLVKDGECKYVLVASILHSAKNRGRIIKEAKRILDKEGRLIIVDWKKKVKSAFNGIGPALNTRLKEEEVKSLVKKAGLVFDKKFKAGRFHYGLIFKHKS